MTEEKVILKELKQHACTMATDEARALVMNYYIEQEYRKSANNQCNALSKQGKSTKILEYFAKEHERLEKQYKTMLEKFVQSQEIGKWLTSITGIGPVIAAGLIAHIDITKCKSAGQIWSYAGYNPTQVWEKHQKRPFNAALKLLCWKVGESFIKVSNNPKDFYGKLYKQRKEYEIKKNEDLEYAEQATHKLATVKIGKNTEAYKWYSKGMLPPAHINERAKRWTVKIFLSHLFAVWYQMVNGEKPAIPYAIAILGHAHTIEIPNWDAKNCVIVVDED